MAPGLPLGVLEALPMPMPPLFASSAPSVSAFAISAPDGYAARPSPLSRLRPSGPSMTLLCAYRVLSCWPAATRAMGTSQTLEHRGPSPRCARLPALLSAFFVLLVPMSIPCHDSCRRVPVHQTDVASPSDAFLILILVSSRRLGAASVLTLVYR